MNPIRRPAIIFNFFFIALVAVVAVNNRPAADDFYYLTCVPANGIISCVSDIFHGYSARWTAYTLAAVVIPQKWFFMLFPVACVVFISLIIAAILRKIALRFYSIYISTADSQIMATMVCAALFFTSFSIAESWFWMIQACTYLMSMAMQLLIFYCLISEKKYLWLIIPAAVFTGGSSESYAFIVISALTALYVFRSKFSGTLFPEKHLRIKILTALLGCMFSFIFMMSSKGNLVRYEALPHAGFTEMIWIIIKTWVKATLIKPLMVSPYYLLFGIICFLTGQQVGSITKPSLSVFLKKHKRLLWLVPVLILVMILPATLVMSGPPPDRALLQVSFVFTILFLFLFFEAGRRVKLLQIKKKILTILSFSALFLMITYHLFTQSFITRHYAKAYDERMASLKKLKAAGEKGMVELKPLPPSGMIYSAEISEHEVHFTNSFLKKYLQLDFEIRKKTD